jgi:hypothetical protein
MSKTNRLSGILAGMLALALATLACNLPALQKTPTQTAEATQPPLEQPTQAEQPGPTPLPPTETPAPDVNFEGITFSYDHALASGVNGAIIPASTYPDAPYWDINPEFYQFDFDGYILSDRFHKPAVRVYSISSYQQVSPDVTGVINNLKEFLNTCPDNPEDIPFLPYWNAAQMLQTKIQCFEFKNGKGVRFVTQYGQAAYPINNNGLFYTFQGLTSDDAYYVAAVFPVSHPSLPENGDNPPDGDWDAFFNNFVPYITNMEQQINRQPDNTFNPALNLLDDLIKSLQVK